MDPGLLVDGCRLRSGFVELRQEILDLEVHDTDIWICTFPKSGTTWTQEATWLLANNLDYEEAKKVTLAVRSPNLEISMFGGKHWESMKFLFPGDNSSVDSVKKMKGSRVIKTHLPFQLLPKQIQNKEKNPKIIYVTRDPKDVLVSAYYFFLNAEERKFSFEDFFGAFMMDMIPFCPYWDHIFSYYDKRDWPNLKIIRYEDMKADLAGQIKELVDYLDINVNLDSGKMTQLLDHLSFDSMRKNRSTNYSEIYEKLKASNMCDEGFQFIRSGKVGEHKQYLTPELNAATNKWIKDNLEKRGVDIKDIPVRCSYE